MCRDGSTDYATLTKSLMKDSKENGIDFLLDTKATQIKKVNNKWEITINGNHKIFTNFLINAAGGQAIDIAHNMKIAKNLTMYILEESIGKRQKNIMA